MAEFLL